MIDKYKIASKNAKETLFSEMNEEGFWRGELSSSPVSTAVACIALHFYDKELYADKISLGLGYLAKSSLNGGFADALGAKPNPTATILSLCAFNLYSKKYAKNIEQTKAYLGDGWQEPKSIKASILKIYGDDLTFSAPILAVCAAVGLLGDNAWNLVPKLPYQLAIIPKKFFALLKLPMVSYAIPALVCVGVCRDFLARGKVSKFRRKFAEILLKKISAMQPKSGGFLEATPLTAFCAICLIISTFKEHSIVKNALKFIIKEQNESWAIDTNLCQWLSSLSVDALKADFSEEKRLRLLDFFEANVWREKHKFTGLIAGGFSWTNTDGGVPDADDTSGALVALYYLKGGKSDALVENAIKWLLHLQNRDGGMPTFCKGWNKLPFDKSCADISAHSIKAFSLWKEHLSGKLKAEVESSILKLLSYVEASQNEDGSWQSLWFGENDLEGGISKVLSTAIVLDHAGSYLKNSEKAENFLYVNMHENGTWGGIDEHSAKYLVTAKCISALSKISKKNAKLDLALAHFLTMPEQSEVIGLYFAKLWYSEKLYSKIFGLNAKENALVYLSKK